MGPINHQPGCSTRMQAACRSKPRYRVLGRLDVLPGSALAGQSMEIAFRPLPAKRQTEFDPVYRPSSACALVAGNLVLAVSIRIRWVCGAPVAVRPAWPGLLWMVPAGACGGPCVHAGTGGRLPSRGSDSRSLGRLAARLLSMMSSSEHTGMPSISTPLHPACTRAAEVRDSTMRPPDPNTRRSGRDALPNRWPGGSPSASTVRCRMARPDTRNHNGSASRSARAAPYSCGRYP